MIQDGHLWAIGFDDVKRAEQFRAEITCLGEKRCLILHDMAVVVRYPDGTTTLDGERFLAATKFSGQTFASFLTSLTLQVPPLTAAAADALVRGAGGVAAGVGIDDAFITEAQSLMRPGTSALFVLDQVGNLTAILEGIRGLGGTVLKTNVNLERAKLIQSTLAAAEAAGSTGGTPDAMEDKV